MSFLSLLGNTHTFSFYSERRELTVFYPTNARRDAEQLIEELAAATKGKSYFIDDNDTSQGLSNAFIGSLTYQPAVSSDQIIVTVKRKSSRAFHFDNLQFSYRFYILYFSPKKAIPMAVSKSKRSGE